MNLPLELREKVHEGVLCRHIDGTKHREYDKIWDYGLEPAILRTCRQVCEEASRILYTKNSVALIRMDTQSYDIFRTAQLKSYTIHSSKSKAMKLGVYRYWKWKSPCFHSTGARTKLWQMSRLCPSDSCRSSQKFANLSPPARLQRDRNLQRKCNLWSTCRTPSHGLQRIGNSWYPSASNPFAKREDLGVRSSSQSLKTTPLQQRSWIL